ncbi:DUF2779 domain-containing protein [Candidatus Phytoplasma meliae]|uniref:DUF2779 domain-containing protein n=1 Tax=Candidatus Phytoplasma meliae TaxID=1848402 RepID=A0ABS5CYY4_9MOLU|nr:DUF2779 domain-containing protein [Candidatus Phytoplasma meliae]MBP5835796.1 DUF2779 domain-containing protein [Candidatus Phytoplasma meliae]MBP5836193.1 DUF2779 domain-containing protein [Candidatus Phytoplasma meliae]
MNISKTRFIKFLKMLKYLKYKTLYQNKKQFLLDFSNELKVLMNEETLDKKISFLLQTYNDEDQETTNLNEKHLEIMQPYYQQLEILLGKYLKNNFQGNIVYSLETHKQKKFQMQKKEHQLYCFLDGYQEDETTIRIFEAKATTSQKFLQLQFKHNNGQKYPFFQKTNPNLLTPYLFEDNIANPLYQDKIKTLINPDSKEGRYIYDLTYQRLVIENSLKLAQKKKKRKYYLVVFNADYVLKKNNCNSFDDPNIMAFIDLTLITEQGQQILEQDSDVLTFHLSNKNQSNLTKTHFLPEKIATFYEKIPPKNSLFTFLFNHHGFCDGQKKYHLEDLIEQKYYHTLDVPINYLHRLDNRIQQKVIATKLPYYCFDKIELGLKTLKYPLYYLDFESFPCPFPRLFGEKPYSHSLFQFSLHIEATPNSCHQELNHVSFLAPNHQDHRKILITKLINAIKDDGGSIIVYHQSFEKNRLKELSLLFPEYRLQLEKLITRIFDLKDLLKGNANFYQKLGLSKEKATGINFYHHCLQGSFSIKKVAPLFCNLSYADLVVQNGIEAFLTYIQLPLMSEKQFQLQYQALQRYCQQDTWVMVEILKNLQIKNKNRNFPHLTFKDIVV